MKKRKSMIPFKIVNAAPLKIYGSKAMSIGI